MNTRLLMREVRRPAAYLALSVAAAALAAVAVRLFVHLYGIGLPAALTLAILQNAPLVLAIGFPLPAWCLMTGADLLAAPFLLHAPGLAGNSWPWPPTVLAGQLLALLLLAARRQHIRVLFMVWATLAAAGWALAHASPPNSDGSDTVLAAGAAVILAGGRMARERAEAQRRLAAEQLANQAERARLTLLEERTRIARELHDVVAHHMSVIAVQADTAAYRIEQLPDVAVDEFSSLAGTARTALTEMRRLLGVLRDERNDPDAAGGRGPTPRLLAPQPGLDRLPELVDGAAKAGIRTRLTLDAAALDRVRDHPGLQLTVYRLVQEGLANVVRHAPGADARVGVALDDGMLRVRVVNEAPPDRAPVRVEPAEAGHGLIGMRERVHLVGGTLAVGALPGGGFALEADIPLPADGGAA